MNEKDLYFKLQEVWVDKTSFSISNSRKRISEGYKKLEAEYQNTIYNLECALKEARINRENIIATATTREILLADVAIEKAQKALDFGKIKAKSDFEIGYLNLKLEIEKEESNLKLEQIQLEYYREQKEKGFSE